MRVQNNPVAVVTGGSGGIGRCIAEALARRGFVVHITGRNEARIEATLRSLEEKSEPSRAHRGYRVDFTDRAALTDWIAQLRSDIDDLDLLVLNAGTAISRPLEETTLEEWDRIFDVNVRAPFAIVRGVLPLLRNATGRIITIGSVVSRSAYPLQGAYTASKHALHGFTKVLAKELHSDRIVVQAILPGGTATDLIGQMRPDIDPENLIRPESVADAVLMLLDQTGGALTDELHLRRAGKEPWP